MSSLPAKLKMKVLDCSQDFSYHNSMGIFPDAQGHLTLHHGQIWSNFEPVQDFMVFLLTCKNEDPIKNKGARVFTTLYIKFSDVQGQITLVFVVVSGRNSNTSKLSCMSSFSAKMRLIKSKLKELECSQDFSHYKSMEDFSRRSRASNSAVLGPIWPNFELDLDVIDFLVTYQYEEDPIKNRGARVFTTLLYINSSDAQGQNTLELVVVSGRNLFSSKLSCMSSLSARMRMIDSKVKDVGSVTIPRKCT